MSDYGDYEDEPPPDDDDWEARVSRNALAEAGPIAPVVNLNAEKPPTEPTKTERIRDAVIWGDGVLNMPPPSALITDLLDLDSLAVLYGPSGSGKSFVAVDWALSVATGTWWMGNEVAAGPVVYVVAEGVGGLGIRVRAWQEHHNVHSCGQTGWLPVAVNLLDYEWTFALAEVVAEIKPRLIVIDTLSRCLVGGDENTSKDIGLAVEAGDRLRKTCGACVLIVHHSGKDMERGARGSSALKAAMTTEIECSSDEESVILKVTKQKDHAEAQPIRMSLVQVGDSCALSRHRGSAGLPPGAIALLGELAAIDTGGGVSSSTWMASSDVAARSFYRWQKGLIEEGYCHKTGERTQARYTVTEQGKQALEEL